MIVTKADEAKTMLFHSKPSNCCAIMIPTTTNAGAVTADVTAVSNGENNAASKKITPVVTAVKPVLPPTPTP